MKKYVSYFKNKDFILSLLLACAFLIVSLVINFYAGEYATVRASNFVTDVVLSNIPVFDVDGIFTYGAVVFWAFIGLLCLYEPQRLPFTLKSVALFVLIRSVFISLTHLGPFPNQAVIDSSILNRFTFGGDLFFSGHTGLPFLMALIFWENKSLRLLFIAAAVIFGVVVLMAHLHYSIDVLAAFFITYGIFHIAKRVFKKDLRLFHEGLAETAL